MKRYVGKGPQAVLPVWVVGTYGPGRRPDFATVIYCGVASGKPPSVTVSLREATQTHKNITERTAFTVTIPSVRVAKETDYGGIRSGRDTNKVAAAGLTAVAGEFVDAPCIEEFPIVIECRLLQTVNAGLHAMFVGECRDVRMDESALDKSGKPDMAALDLLICGPSSCYHAVGPSAGKTFSIGTEIA